MKIFHANRFSVRRNHTYLLGLACIMVFSVFLGTRAIAATINVDRTVTVTAKVQAPPSIPPPVIKSPQAGSTVANQTVIVQGTCTKPGSIINVLDNDKLVGSTNCSEAGTFELKITLLKGSNNITAIEIIGSVSMYSPNSSPIKVNYSPGQNSFICRASSSQQILIGFLPLLTGYILGALRRNNSNRQAKK